MLLVTILSGMKTICNSETIVSTDPFNLKTNSFTYVFNETNDDDGMFDKMTVGIVLWAFKNPQQTNVILLSKYLRNETEECLKTLYGRGYYILVSYPLKELNIFSLWKFVVVSQKCIIFNWLW